MRLERRTRALRVVRHRAMPAKNSTRAPPLDPGGKEVKTQGVSVRAIRKPTKLNRSPAEELRRLAERM
jgi:hypothetical protein